MKGVSEAEVWLTEKGVSWLRRRSRAAIIAGALAASGESNKENVHIVMQPLASNESGSSLMVD